MCDTPCARVCLCVLVCAQGVFVLEHNRQCDVLAAAHPDWKDEQLFQEARLRVMALLQVITYQEYVSACVLACMRVCVLVCVCVVVCAHVRWLTVTCVMDSTRC